MIPQGPASFSALDWTAICRRVVEAQRVIFDQHRGIAARTVYDGQGEGGDWALVIDRLCEEAVFEELEALAAQGGHSFTAVSEERGEVSYGDAGAPARVIVDPIDGSLNARRTIPSHCLSLAVSSGPSMAEVDFGYVYDFGAGEEFGARRGQGAWLDGHELVGEAMAEPSPDGRLEVVGLEGMEPSRILPAIELLRDRVYRFRAVGAIAISLGYVAAGRFDGMLTARPCRSVDAAAGQLIARESGAGVAFGDLGLEEVPVDLDARYMLVSARGEAGMGSLLEAQGAIPDRLS